MGVKSRIGRALLAVVAVAAIGSQGAVAQAVEPAADVAADWKFQQSNTTGSIDGGDLVVKDVSGNGNDLTMQVYGKGDYRLSDYVSWSDLSMNGDAGGSLRLNGDSDLANKKNLAARDPKGADFITGEDAPINDEQFADGYTIEFVYYLPDDFNAGQDQWMGMIARQSVNNNMDEHEMGSMSLAISNCKETQFKAANKDNESTANTEDPNNGVTSWGVTMDHGGVWYHIAVVSDGQNVVTYLNGAEGFRNINANGDGLYADPTDGRFRIGSSYYNDTFDTSVIDKADLDKFLRGNLQEVRISRGAVDQSQWLIPNPTDYIGEYGTNDRFALENASVHNMVFVPDTQNTIRWRPEVMDAAIDGLAADAASQNVTNIVSLGDIVDNWDSEDQWNRADEVFGRLQAIGVPFLEQPGNHDYNAWNDQAGSYGAPGSRRATNYLRHFGPDSEFGARQRERHGFVYSPDGMSSYVLVDNGSYEYLVVNIDMGAVTGNSSATGNDDMRWFEQVLRDHPDNPTVVVSHDIFKCSDSNPNEISLDDDGGYNGEGGDSEGAGSKIWNIVRKYDQVFMMYGGHNHGSGQMTLVNDSGHEVLGLLADYQFGYNGGNAFMQYVSFDEANGRLAMRTYSPYAATLADGERSFFDVNFLTGEGNVYEQDFDFETRFAGMKHSADYDLQQRIVSVVRGIAALNPQDPDKDQVKTLYDMYVAFPDDVKADFGDAADPSTQAGFITAAYQRLFPADQPAEDGSQDGDGTQDGGRPSGGQTAGDGGTVAEDEGETRPGRLSDTGSAVSGVVALAVAVAAAGTAMALVRRRLTRRR